MQLTLCATDIVWAQDEPANQGQWPFMAVNLLPLLDRRVRLASAPQLLPRLLYR